MADKEKLEELNKKKEDAFQKKQEVGTRIAEKINQISNFRDARNELTNKVQELKKERDALNQQITDRINEIKKERGPQTKKKDVPTDKRGRPLRPGALQRQIKGMEEKLETVPMSFKAEQKLNKRIKDLKKQYDELQDALGLSGELAEKSKEIDALKKQANTLHAKVTDLAKESQQHHEKMLTLSEEVEDLKKKEDEYYQEFLKHKEEYVKISGDKKAEEQSKRKEKKAAQARKRKKQKEAEEKTLKERAREAEKKVSSGKKLTTEDLLALQATDE